MAASTGPFRPIQQQKTSRISTARRELPTWRVSRSWSKRLVSNPARSPSPAVAVALTGTKKIWNDKGGDNWKKCETYFEMATYVHLGFEVWKSLIGILELNILWEKFKFGIVVGILDVFKSMTCLCLKGPEGEDGVTVAGGSCRVSLQAVGSTQSLKLKQPPNLRDSQVDIIDSSPLYFLNKNICIWRMYNWIRATYKISPCHIFFGFHRTPPLDHYPTWCHVMPSLQHHGPCPTSVTDQVDHCPPRNVATSSPVDLEASLVFHHEQGGWRCDSMVVFFSLKCRKNRWSCGVVDLQKSLSGLPSMNWYLVLNFNMSGACNLFIWM